MENVTYKEQEEITNGEEKLKGERKRPNKLLASTILKKNDDASNNVDYFLKNTLDRINDLKDKDYVVGNRVYIYEFENENKEQFYMLSYSITNDKRSKDIKKKVNGTILTHFHKETKSIYTLNALIYALAVQEGKITDKEKYEDITDEMKKEIRDISLNWTDYKYSFMTLNDGKLIIRPLTFIQIYYLTN